MPNPSPGNAPSKRFVVIVDHGSRRPEAHDSLRSLAARVGDALPDRRVRIAHLEIAEPSLPDALDACVRDGAEEVVVYPYFLGPGRHSREDIPGLVEAAARTHGSVAFHLEPPFGENPGIPELVTRTLR